MPEKRAPGNAQGAPPNAMVRSYTLPVACGAAVPVIGQPLMLVLTPPSAVTVKVDGRTPRAKPASPEYVPAEAWVERPSSTASRR